MHCPEKGAGYSMTTPKTVEFDRCPKCDAYLGVRFTVTVEGGHDVAFRGTIFGGVSVIADGFFCNTCDSLLATLKLEFA